VESIHAPPVSWLQRYPAHVTSVVREQIRALPEDWAAEQIRALPEDWAAEQIRALPEDWAGALHLSRLANLKANWAAASGLAASVAAQTQPGLRLPAWRQGGLPPSSVRVPGARFPVMAMEWPPAVQEGCSCCGGVLVALDPPGFRQPKPPPHPLESVKAGVEGALWQKKRGYRRRNGGCHLFRLPPLAGLDHILDKKLELTPEKTVPTWVF